MTLPTTRRKSTLNFTALFAIIIMVCLLLVYGMDILLTTPRHENQWYYRWADASKETGKLPEWINEGPSNEGWNKLRVPGKPQNSNNSHLVWFRVELPNKHWEDPTLFFTMFQQSFEVYYEGKVIYSYGNMNYKNTNKAPGSALNLVPLPEGYQDKVIFIKAYCPFTEYTGRITDVTIGPKSEIILELFKRNFDTVILAFIFVFLGFLIIVVALSNYRESKDLLSLGLTSLSLGIWLLTESKVSHFAVSNHVLLMYLGYFCIYTMPVALCYYIAKSFDFGKNPLMSSIWKIFLGFGILSFTLEFLSIVSIFVSVKLFHVMLVSTIVYMLVNVLIIAVKGNRGARSFLFGLLFMCLTGIHDILAIFYLNTGHVSKTYTQWGMLAVILSLLFIFTNNMLNVHESLKEYSKRTETDYRSLFENMADCFVYGKILTDDNGQAYDCSLLEINGTFEKEFGLKHADVVGLELSKCLAWYHIEDIVKAFCEVGENGEMQKFTKYIGLIDRWYNISVFSAKTGFFSAVFTDITASKRAEELIRSRAFRDPMTGLYNRTYFEQEIAKINSEIKVFKPISIISIDIDGLKITNDTFGHQAGDELIKASAQIIAKAFRNTDIVSRIGGDEFCVVLPDTDYAAAYTRKERIFEMVDEYNSTNPPVQISMSVGIAASYEEKNEDILEIFKRADDRMYQYKLTQTVSLKSKVIDMLLTALSERDFVSYGHVERLVNLAGLMSEKLGLSDIITRDLVLLAKVHDLGKIGIPDEILFKPGPLNEDEYTKMKEHAYIGYNIANRSKELANIASLILHHHEFWNGKGYPEGLKGEEIPLECRILSIIDAYDAMTSDRPYHKGISSEDAIMELERCSSTQFDPYLAVEFVDLIKGLKIAESEAAAEKL